MRKHCIGLSDMKAWGSKYCYLYVSIHACHINVLFNQTSLHMGSSEYPDFIARFYDVIYHHVRDGVDNDFFLQQAMQAGGKVLELGVGTGRLFTGALRKGVDIYGVDISSTMAEIARSKLPDPEQYRIRTADAVTMKWDMEFQLIIAPFRMFSHILTVERQLDLLNNMHRHLVPGGQFIFDVYVPDPGLLARGISELNDFTGEYEPGKKLKRIINSRSDIVNQLTEVSMKLIWDEGMSVKEAEWKFPMRFFFRYELEHLVRISNLQLQTIYGDYQMQSLGPASKDFIVVCTR